MKEATMMDEETTRRRATRPAWYTEEMHEVQDARDELNSLRKNLVGPDYAQWRLDMDALVKKHSDLYWKHRPVDVYDEHPSGDAIYLVCTEDISGAGYEVVGACLLRDEAMLGAKELMKKNRFHYWVRSVPRWGIEKPLTEEEKRRLL